jgi:hypothetical protein
MPAVSGSRTPGTTWEPVPAVDSRSGSQFPPLGGYGNQGTSSYEKDGNHLGTISLKADVKTSEVAAPKEGKGEESGLKNQKRPFVCRHHYALVSKRLVGSSPKPKNPGVRYTPAVFLLQTCRRCAAFRASIFAWCWGNGCVQMTRQVRFLPAGEANTTDIFKLEEGRSFEGD